MLLSEIKFNKKVDVIWNQNGNNLIGTFKLDSDTFQIDLNLFEITLSSKTVNALDIAFRKNLRSDLTHDNKPFNVFGPVVNAIKSKLDDLNVDIILFGVLNKDGKTQERLDVYHKLSFFMSKSTSFGSCSKWYDIGVGKYTYMLSKNFNFSNNDLNDLDLFFDTFKGKLGG